MVIIPKPMKPMVSVITACYNGSLYLDESIQSILQQTFNNFEFILIDDGSTDSSADIMRKYACKDNRISFYPLQKNVGAAEARNLAVKVARGGWIAILDADDVAFPERLQRQVMYAEKENLLMLGSGCIEINFSGKQIKEHYYPCCQSKLLKRLELKKAFFPHSSCLYHAGTVKHFGGFNSRFVRSQDVDLWFRLGEAGQIACLQEPLVKLRRHSGGISNHKGGETQFIMGMAARVCHFLRIRKAADPSIQDLADWVQFINWLKDRLHRERSFEINQRWLELRRYYYNRDQGKRIFFDIKLIKSSIWSELTLKAAFNRLLGSSLPKSLADEWLRKKIELGADLLKRHPG